MRQGGVPLLDCSAHTTLRVLFCFPFFFFRAGVPDTGNHGPGPGFVQGWQAAADAQVGVTAHERATVLRGPNGTSPGTCALFSRVRTPRTGCFIARFTIAPRAHRVPLTVAAGEDIPEGDPGGAQDARAEAEG